MDPTLDRTFRGHKDAVTSLSFAPGQPLKQLVSGSLDGCLMLWNFKQQLRAFRFLGHREAVNHVEYSPSGQLVASASQDRTVRLWLPTARGESSVLKGHSGAVRSVSFSQDSHQLITASDDKTVKVWSLPSKKFRCTLSGHSNWVRSAVFSPDARLAVSGSDDKLVKLWDISTQQTLRDFPDHEAEVNKVLFTPDGTCIASCSTDKTIKMWDARSYQLLQHYPAHDAGVTSISIHPSGLYLLSSSMDATHKIWDLREGQLLFTLRGHEGATTCATFSHQDGAFFATGGVDKMVNVWKSNLESFSSSSDMGEPTESFSRDKPTHHHEVPSPTVNKTSNKVSGKPLNNRNIARPTKTEPPRKYRVDDIDNSPDLTSSKIAEGGGGGSVSRDALPEVLTSTLDHIVGQLDMLTRTMAVLEQRVCNTEDRISEIVKVQDEMMGQFTSPGPVD